MCVCVCVRVRVFFVFFKKEAMKARLTKGVNRIQIDQSSNALTGLIATDPSVIPSERNMSVGDHEQHRGILESVLSQVAGTGLLKEASLLLVLRFMQLN